MNPVIPLIFATAFISLIIIIDDSDDSVIEPLVVESCGELNDAFITYQSITSSRIADLHQELKVSEQNATALLDLIPESLPIDASEEHIKQLVTYRRLVEIEASRYELLTQRHRNELLEATHQRNLEEISVNENVE